MALSMELELHHRLLNYKRELQTLHVIQGREYMQEFIDEVLRENPEIFSNTTLLDTCRTQLSDDPRQEALRAILTAATLCNHQHSMTASPEPLPVPNPEIIQLPSSSWVTLELHTVPYRCTAVF
ncbi:hypothetical protein BC826DRAFT_1110493 [Russula brevipes]|nr:hypothetical protein BC826DRAFT_1110493 [Russula brevipes]